jgi:hypothetical protein
MMNVIKLGRDVRQKEEKYNLILSQTGRKEVTYIPPSSQ